MNTSDMHHLLRLCTRGGEERETGWKQHLQVSLQAQDSWGCSGGAKQRALSTYAAVVLSPLS